ncbi:MAG: transposase family protein [Planctomycetota bacterium]|jgi:transposase InsO family protein
MDDDESLSIAERWARLRFSVVGPLLASPPPPGQLRAELERLAGKHWLHPTKDEQVKFGLSTIERWLYHARATHDPVIALRRKTRSDAGLHHTINDELAQAVRQQYKDHPKWSYQLHLDNLVVLPELKSVPSYSTLRRVMVEQGLIKQPRKGLVTLSAREQRSYETEYVNGLWHLDFHHGSLKVLTSVGQWVTPILLAVLDDRSRLACHAQWYFDETTQTLVHGLSQALLKRGLARSQMTDGGPAMKAGEMRQGLSRLSIRHRLTLPYSPEQNAKQEVFWAQVEGRLLPMLEGHRELTLSLLNQATQAWVEMEYQRKVHSETGQTPLQRWLDGPSVARPCPDPETLRLAFTVQRSCTQRKSDGTVSIQGVRFEIPDRFRGFKKLRVRYARWNLGHVWLLDPRSETTLARLFPLDKAKNADGIRRPRAALRPDKDPPQPSGIAPLLRKLMADYAATGLPPAYIPKEES